MIAEDVMAFPSRALSSAGTCAEGLDRCNRRKLLCEKLSDALAKSAENAGIRVQRGILAWVSGPSYETAAEASAFSALGADAVTMSIFPELIAASRLGLRCAVLSFVTNLAASFATRRITHEEVLSRGEEACSNLAAMLFRLPSLPSSL